MRDLIEKDQNTLFKYLFYYFKFDYLVIWCLEFLSVLMVVFGVSRHLLTNNYSSLKKFTKNSQNFNLFDCVCH